MEQPCLLWRAVASSRVVALQFSTVLQWFPITTDLSAWYSGIGLTGACLLLGLTVYGFYTSLGGQPLFGRVSLED